MKIGITGGNGFIGRNLVRVFREGGWDVLILRRKDFTNENMPGKLEGCDVIINLAGESIVGLWTRKKKRRIYESRIKTTRMLVEEVNDRGRNVKLFINASAVGIYEHGIVHNENSNSLNRNFLGHVITDWEREVENIKGSDVRVVILRLGIVLGIDGGIFPRVAKLFKLGIGYSIGSDEGLPFIHITDLQRVVMWIIGREGLLGVLNAVSPENVTIRNFYRTIGEVSMKRIRFKIPTWFLKAIMGESSLLVTRGQWVYPEKLIMDGYVFKFSTLKKAVMNLFEKVSEEKIDF